MPDDFLKKIDWNRPWLSHLQNVARLVLSAESWRDGLNEQAAARNLKNHLSLPIQFVPQEELPEGMAYESFISQTGCVPTRSNLHDFFNALVWLSFPHIKVRLNAIQAAEITHRSASPPVRRGSIRDAATIFDENAVLLLTSDPALGTALRAHDWHQLFLQRRHDFQSCVKLRLFGHALMEKLVNPYKAITGHTWIVNVAPEILLLTASDLEQWLDREVACQLRAGLSTSQFAHLPVLGVPGWCNDQEEAFYEDKAVFRPARSKSAH